MELIVIACLLSAPDECQSHRLRLTLDGMDAGQCLYSSLPRIARWQTLHAKWKVKSWHCAVVSKDRRI